MSVLVPADRIGAFQVALGTFHQTKTFPVASPGSTGDQWRRLSVEVGEVGVFYHEFGRWLA